MDCTKLFALLVAVASVYVTADGPKKKIRIHLPEKVKHIHHHKKIYITNHPASSQYAPAYLRPEASVGVPNNAISPIPHSSELYDEIHRVPGVPSAASKVVPLYHARGYYGPKPTEWEEEDYDLAPPDEYADSYYSQPSPPPNPPKRPAKRVKLVKVNDAPRKKTHAKNKPKRVVSRPKPAHEEEHPVTTYHEEFYSDLEGTGTIRKIKKPPRVEKIIDGDTEHIHTYSEEHIHKLVYDANQKGLLGPDALGSMSALAASHPLAHLRNGQLVGLPTDGLTNFASPGPATYEYSGYNNRDVTHDHIFHEHGELPPGIDVPKNTLFPPKVSYNSQGLRISGAAPVKRVKNKNPHRVKPTKPTPGADFSYYENIYTPNKLKTHRPVVSNNLYDSAPESSINFKPIPFLKFNKPANKIRPPPGAPVPFFGNLKQNLDFRQPASIPSPFSVSSTIVHEYEPKDHSIPSVSGPGFIKIKDPFINFKDSFTNNFEYDTYASSSNVYKSEDKNVGTGGANSKGKKKSVSTQNISFGSQDHQSIIDHLEDSISEDEAVPTAIDNFDEDRKKLSDQGSTPYTIKETSPAHHYYSAMAVKALHGDEVVSMPEASNNHYQYVEPPTPAPAPFSSPVPTTPTPQVYEQSEEDSPTSEPAEFITDTRPIKRPRDKSRPSNIQSQYVTKGNDRPTTLHVMRQHPTNSSDKGNLKYGDKI